MGQIRIVSLLAVLALAALSTSGSAELIFSDDFSSDTVGSTELVNWEVLQGDVEVVACGSDETCVDLGGTVGGDPVSILTNPRPISIPGLYAIEFSMLDGGQATSFLLTVGLYFSQVFSDYSFPFTDAITFTVSPLVINSVVAVITDTLPITFTMLDAPTGFGPLLNSVSLRFIEQAIPEPSTLALLFIALAGLAAARLGRFAKG